MSIDVRRQQLRVSVGKTFIGTSLPILVAHLISQQQLAYLVCAHLVLGVIMMRLTLGSNDDADRSKIRNFTEMSPPEQRARTNVVVISLTNRAVRILLSLSSLGFAILFSWTWGRQTSIDFVRFPIECLLVFIQVYLSGFWFLSGYYGHCGRARSNEWNPDGCGWRKMPDGMLTEFCQASNRIRSQNLRASLCVTYVVIYCTHNIVLNAASPPLS